MARLTLNGHSSVTDAATDLIRVPFDAEFNSTQSVNDQLWVCDAQFSSYARPNVGTLICIPTITVGACSSHLANGTRSVRTGFVVSLYVVAHRRLRSTGAYFLSCFASVGRRLSSGRRS